MENLKDIRIYHAFVLHGSIGDVEHILEFIRSQTSSRVVFERHSGNYLRIVEERPYNPLGGSHD